MPGPKSLVAFAVCAAVLLHWAMGDIFEGDGPGVMVAAAFLASLALGCAGGVLTHAAMLVNRKLFGFNSVVVAVMGFLLMPATLWAWIEREEWSRRPASEACLTSHPRVALGGVLLKLSMNPIISIVTRPGGPTAILDFSYGADSRTFCDRAEAGDEPIPIQAMFIGFERLRPPLDRTTATSLATACGALRDRADADKILCVDELASAQRSHGLAGARIYDPATYHRGLEFPQTDSTFRAYAKPGRVTRQADNLLVQLSTHDGRGDPILMVCYKQPGQSKEHFCKTTYTNANGLQTSLDLLLTVEDAAAEGSRAVRQVAELLRAMTGNQQQAGQSLL